MDASLDFSVLLLASVRSSNTSSKTRTIPNPSVASIRGRAPLISSMHRRDRRGNGGSLGERALGTTSTWQRFGRLEGARDHTGDRKPGRCSRFVNTVGKPGFSACFIVRPFPEEGERMSCLHAPHLLVHRANAPTHRQHVTDDKVVQRKRFHIAGVHGDRQARGAVRARLSEPPSFIVQ